jgi:protein gp37
VWTGEFREAVDALDKPLHWKAPQTIFVNSMSDLFGEGVSNEYIASVFGVMAATRQHTYQMLTKRADRLPAWVEWVASMAKRGNMIGGPRETIFVRNAANKLLARDCADLGLDVRMDPANELCFEARPWPLPNVWLGVSVEDRKHGLPRIEHLRRTPAAVRFLSIEPLLEDLGEINLDGIHWVIVGGESGSGARPFDVAWARSIRDQCRAANVPCFVKQLGAHVIWDGNSSPGEHWPTGTKHEDTRLGHWRARLSDKKGGAIGEWPEDLRIREMPKGLK